VLAMNARKAGWLPDLPDANDYTLKTDKINALIRQIQILRGFDDFLESFGKSLDKPPFPWNLVKNIFGSGVDPQVAVSQLREDIQIILKDLNSGIDLIAASPDPNAKNYQPLLPPISIEVLRIFREIVFKGDPSGSSSISFDRFSDETLIEIRKILHQVAPLAKYGKGEALEAAINEARQLRAGDLSAKTLKKENIIQINPATMYDLLERDDEAVASSRLRSISSGQINPASDKNIPLLRLPLSCVLSRQLRGQSVRNFVLPDIVDLSYWCSPVRDQGEYNSCTSHSVTSLVEYFQNRLADRPDSGFTPTSLSARFLYKVSRHLGSQSKAKRTALEKLVQAALITNHGDLENQSKKFLSELEALAFNFSAQRNRISEKIKKDYVSKVLSEMLDVGASIRQTFNALHLFGIPPEKYWPYHVDSLDFDDEPPQFCYAFAQNYQTVKYFRLDLPGEIDSGIAIDRDLVLTQIKAVLAAGFPAVCGFLYEPDQDDSSGEILFPSDVAIQAFKDFRSSQGESDKTSGDIKLSEGIVGHAVLVVGYSDIKEINGEKGAFLFQNSYGEGWGDKGYGWLSYRFVIEGLATDWWSLLSSAWVEVGDFGLDIVLGQERRVN
jgi:C1A family cysteine protease